MSSGDERRADTSGVAGRAAAAAAAKVEQAAQTGQQGQPGTAVSPYARQESIIATYADQFKEAMPRGLEVRQLLRDAYVCLRTIKKLDQADMRSVVGSLMTAAQLGLRPGVLGQCWPIPFWNSQLDVPGKRGKGGYSAQLIIGYKGYVNLAHQSGIVADITGRAVYEHDVFEMSQGSEEWILHKRAWNKQGGRGPMAGAYCVVNYRGGGQNQHAMDLIELTEHRDKYAPKNKAGDIVGPWANPSDFEDMCVKTVWLQLARWVPKSMQDSPLLTRGLMWDGRLRTSLDPDANPDSESVPPEQAPDPMAPPEPTDSAPLLTVSIDGTDHMVSVPAERASEGSPLLFGWECRVCDFVSPPEFESQDVAMADHQHYASTADAK